MKPRGLVRIERNDIFTDTTIIAEGTGIAHRKVKDQIRKYENQFKELGLLASYQAESSGGRPEEYFELNEPQASFLITLLKNTPVVVAFKLKLVKEFYRMRCLLAERQTIEWQEARLLTKQVRLQETDAIKELVEYAKAQGSQNADKLYISYSKLIKSLGEYETRDTARTDTLVMVATFEHLLTGIITKEMTLNTHYKKIYQKAKAQLQELRQLWLIPHPLPLEAAQ